MKRADFDPQQGSVLRKALIVLAVIIVALGAWIFFTQDRGGTGSNSAAQQTADQFTDYLVAKNVGASYDMLTEASKTATPLDLWEEWVTISFEGASDAAYKTEQPVVDPTATYGDNPVVRYLYTFVIDGKSYDAPIVLVEQEGSWKVSDIGAFQ